MDVLGTDPRSGLGSGEGEAARSPVCPEAGSGLSEPPEAGWRSRGQFISCSSLSFYMFIQLKVAFF